MGSKKLKIDFFDRSIEIEIGKVAKQADGAALVTCGGTAILATVVASEDEKKADFLPLTVDVEERLYAAGKIPGSFFKREGRPTDTATLTARIIDRSIRPCFSKYYRNETQVVVTVLSADKSNPPDMLALFGVSAALALSGIPCDVPIGGVRVGLAGEKWVVNPTFEEQSASPLNLVIAGNKSSILMVEAGADEVTEDMMTKAIAEGQNGVKKQIEIVETLVREYKQENGEKSAEQLIGEVTDFVCPRYKNAAQKISLACEEGDLEKAEKGKEDIENVVKEASAFFPPSLRKLVKICSSMEKSRSLNEALEPRIKPLIKQRIQETLLKTSAENFSKKERSIIVNDLLEGIAQELIERYPALEKDVREILSEAKKEALREQILNKGIRPDGRKAFNIRKITCEVGLLPRTHGSALFSRGETQVLTIATLGSYAEKQILDDLGVEEYKRFLHHYNFPPYSTGEASPMRGPKRREIGHGALAERALLPLIPGEEDFPYTIRLVSEVLESNGSTSMASVCASSMALMDAGVPLKNGKHVGGIAMGLVMEGENYVILSDIEGMEDAIGDMDFKVAGTKDGITALQMDVKCPWLSAKIMEEALQQASQGRLFIIKAMSQAIEGPRAEVSPGAPVILNFEIPVDKIGDLIGPGGRNIKGLIERYDVEIDVENDGRVFVYGKDKDKVDAVKKQIELLTKKPEVGDTFLGKVVKTTNFGAFVEILPGKDGLLHISKISKERIARVEDVLNVGDEIPVEIEEIDDLGRISLKRTS
ncbi:MAG: polyribonucleotide nucleotidyltransferase [Actinomycetota bacterium]|nr:polyribonucleotide nucleotidyltransferase [Actinomycetota bacterium]